MKKRLYALLLSLSCVISLLPIVSVPVKADEITPTVIYSTIEGGSMQVALNNALYPITSTSTRTWYCNGSVVTPDGTNIIDFSEGQNGKLKLATTTTANHMQNYAVIDTTASHAPGQIIPNQIARVYVISTDNYDAATLSTRELTATVGEDLYAKDITLYINSTPYPNFQPLRFVVGGNVVEKITVEAGTKTYNLTDTVRGRSTTISIVGVDDTEPPRITSLAVKDGKQDVYALTKTIEVIAQDNNGLPEDAYYWEENANLSTVIKERIMNGDKAGDLTGITWSNNTTHEATCNGIYTIFVKDKAGNISYKDITISKISTSSPYISSLSLGKDGDTVFIDVSASEPGNQPISYKLNDGNWQSSNRLTNVKEGTNTVYVKNEAGVEVTANKEVFLSVYLNNDAAFSAENLYNYIQVNPTTWTNKSVTVSLVLPDSIQAKCASAPYSINGGAFTSSRSISVSNNNDTVQFCVKDIYGNTHTSNVYTVINIDKELPSIEVTTQEDGTITVKAQDGQSGVSKIVVSSTNASNFIIKANGGPGVGSDQATYKAPANGAYQFEVYDFAGNVVKASGQVSCYAKDGTIQSGLKNSKTSTKQTRTGSTTGGKSGASTLGTKASKKANDGSGTHVKTSSSSSRTSEDRGYTSFSLAGRTNAKTLPEAEQINVVKNEESRIDAPAQLMEEVAADTTNNDKLKRLAFILLPILVIGSIASVVIINSDKLFKKK